MKWNDFFAAIDSGQFATVYTFVGPEEYIKREALDTLKKKLLPPGLEALNDTVLEGVTARQITDAADTMPFMCQRRIVTVRDWAPLLPTKPKGNARSTDDEGEVEWMKQWLADPPENCVLVFYMQQDIDKRRKMTGLLQKTAETVQFDPLQDGELARWCAGKLKPMNKKISRSALTALTGMAGRDLTRLSGELEKLAAYLGDDRPEITEADVTAVVSPSVEYNVFQLLGSLLSADMEKAMQTLQSLLRNGEEPMRIMALLSTQLRQMTHMKYALDAGRTVQSVQEQLNMHPYAAKQTARLCSGLSAGWLSGMYEKCVEWDFEIKSGRLRDREALNALVLQLGLAKDRSQ